MLHWGSLLGSRFAWLHRVELILQLLPCILDFLHRFLVIGLFLKDELKVSDGQLKLVQGGIGLPASMIGLDVVHLQFDCGLGIFKGPREFLGLEIGEGTVGIGRGIFSEEL